IEEKTSPYFSPRLTDALYGRFWRPLIPGNYTLTVRKKGYETHTQSVFVSPTGWTNRTVNLVPLVASVVSGTVTNGVTPLDGQIVISDVVNDTLDFTGGTFSINSNAQEHNVCVYAPGYYPYIGTHEFAAGTYGMTFDLDSADSLFEEEWENGTTAWVIDGPWQVIDDLSWNGNAITDSWGGYGFYAANCDVSIQTANPIDLSGRDNVMLLFREHLYTEPVFDPVTVEISTDETNWTEVYRNSGQHDEWKLVFVDLSDYNDDAYYLRFRLQDDSYSSHPTLVDPGWTIDNIQVIAGSSSATGAGNATVPKVLTHLRQNFPNPFNPETTIAFAIGETDVKKAEISVYNIRGERVYNHPLSNEDVQRGSVVWNAEKNPSGIYFYRLNVNGKNYPARKACLIK
ncbi:MAG: T9SS type A sorting domain-containing protein, partial [Candidatus Cloacimonetes bacterium]|nr:T9SS type A sorting domain-containing protein [Candidatus Cloacimonadota bacterium]